MSRRCRNDKKKCMSDSNLYSVKTIQNLQHNDRGQTNTYSAQYTPQTAADLRNIQSNVKETFKHNVPGYEFPCYNFPPPNPPPCPCPPENDLWDLQFCRWWGWNWVRKRDELMKKQKYSACNKSNGFGTCDHKPIRKRQKQDDFFSWCNKLFKGGRRNKPCPLKEKEMQQLQEMYDTPSDSTSKCYEASQDYNCKPVNLIRKYGCYCNSGREPSIPTVCQNKTRRQIEKCKKRNHQSWLCEKQSSSSEEYCPRVSVCPKKATDSGTETSVEYLSLRMECIKSDCEDNGHVQRCCKRIGQKHTSPCRKKQLYSKPCNYTLQCCRTSPKEICQCTQSPQCRFCCKYCNQTAVRFPRFTKHANKCMQQNVLVPHHKRKEYVIHWPLLHWKKQKPNCTCCQCATSHEKAKKSEMEKNSKVMIDKSINCPDQIQTTLNEAVQKPKTFKDTIYPNKNDAINKLKNPVSSVVENGFYASPASGKVYHLNPHLISETLLSHHTRLPKVLNFEDKILQCTTDNFSELPLVDTEHNLIMRAVWDAMMSSRVSDHESDKSSEDQSSVYNFTIPVTEGCYEQFKPTNAYNNERDTQKLENRTGNVLKSNQSKHVYFKTARLSSNIGSRIPLLKHRLNRTNLVTSQNNSLIDYADNIHNAATETADLTNCKEDASTITNYDERNVLQQNQTVGNCNHFFGTNIKHCLTVSEIPKRKIDPVPFNSPQYKNNTPRPPCISMTGLFSAISNAMVNNSKRPATEFNTNKENVQNQINQTDVEIQRNRDTGNICLPNFESSTFNICLNTQPGVSNITQPTFSNSIYNGINQNLPTGKQLDHPRYISENKCSENILNYCSMVPRATPHYFTNDENCQNEMHDLNVDNVILNTDNSQDKESNYNINVEKSKKHMSLTKVSFENPSPREDNIFESNKNFTFANTFNMSHEGKYQNLVEPCFRYPNLFEELQIGKYNYNSSEITPPVVSYRETATTANVTESKNLSPCVRPHVPYTTTYENRSNFLNCNKLVPIMEESFNSDIPIDETPYSSMHLQPNLHRDLEHFEKNDS